MSGFTSGLTVHDEKLKGNTQVLEKPFSMTTVANKVREGLDLP